MHKSPVNQLSSSEMRTQLRRFAEINTTSQAARSMRYEQGMPQPEHATEQTDDTGVSLDITQGHDPIVWQCTKCGAKLDGSTLKIYKSKFAFNGKDLAMCPHCGGAARNLYIEAIERAEAEHLEIINRKIRLRNGILCGAAGGLFLLTPNTLTYLLLWIMVFWFGPLADIHLKMKLGAVFTIMWAGFFGMFVVNVLGMDHFGKLMVWLLITVVLVAAGWLIEKMAAFGGGLFYKG